MASRYWAYYKERKVSAPKGHKTPGSDAPTPAVTYKSGPKAQVSAKPTRRGKGVPVVKIYNSCSGV